MGAKQASLCTPCCENDKVAAGTVYSLATQDFAKGDFVQVVSAFKKIDDEERCIDVPVGTSGWVMATNEEGFVRLELGELGEHWVTRKDIGKLRKLEPESALNAESAWNALNTVPTGEETSEFAYAEPDASNDGESEDNANVGDTKLRCVVVGAGGIGTALNGVYVPMGMLNDKLCFDQKRGNARISYREMWKIRPDRDSPDWVYHRHHMHQLAGVLPNSGVELLPPEGKWTACKQDADPAPIIRLYNSSNALDAGVPPAARTSV